ncbi:MAG: heat-inducible transcriptional repressor HrcA [Cyanobacteria bacterium J06614_10]
MKLNPRQQKILRATVRHYVSTAEPVGSRSLAKGYNLQVSAATIRNVMSVLEDSGLLYQPHTSAGRIPSDSGYRTYVNELMAPPQPLTRQMETVLSLELDRQDQALESLLQESAQILSRLSGYIALVTLPQMDTALIKHLQLVRVSEQQLLLVVLDIYHNHSILLRLPSEVIGQRSDDDIDRELQILSNFLSEQLQGRSLHDAEPDWSHLDQAFQQYADTLQGAIADLSRRSRAIPTPQILVSGVAEALDQPEFAEREQIRSIVQLLEDGKELLWPLITASVPSPPNQTAAHSNTTDLATLGLTPASKRPIEPTLQSTFEETFLTQHGLRIWIGEENPVEPMRSCALVTSQYGSAPGPIGSLGVLGPTRMLYENAIAAVEAAANYLTDAVSGTLTGEAPFTFES